MASHRHIPFWATQNDNCEKSKWSNFGTPIPKLDHRGSKIGPGIRMSEGAPNIVIMKKRFVELGLLYHTE